MPPLLIFPSCLLVVTPIPQYQLVYLWSPHSQVPPMQPYETYDTISFHCTISIIIYSHLQPKTNLNITGQRLVETRTIDSRVGQYAAVISGQMKEWQGCLLWLTGTTTTIECVGGQQQSEITGPWKNFVLM